MGEKRAFRGDIPSLHVQGDGIAQAWENSVVELYNNGGWYKRDGPKDKGRLQVDATMMITVNNPDSPRFLHRYCGGGWDNFLDYEMEMLGAKNSLVHDPNLDPKDDTRWPYHYSDALLNYGVPGSDKPKINQLEGMIEGLIKEPWNRRKIAITWVPERDIGNDDPPCLQTLWVYTAPISDNPQQDGYKLNLNSVFRSRNVMRASPMNLRGLNIIQSYIRDNVIERSDMKLVNGRIVDQSFSYHVTAKDLPLLEGFMKKMEKAQKGETETDQRTIDGRCFDEEAVNDLYEEARPGVEAEIIRQVTRRNEERLKRRKEKLEEQLKENKALGPGDRTIVEAQLELADEEFDQRLQAEIEKIKAISESRRR